MRKKEMLLLTDEAIKSCNNQRFCRIFKKRFCDVDDSDDDSDDDSNGDSNGEDFLARKFHGDAAELDDDDFYDHDENDDDNEKFGVRKFHGDVSGLDDADDDYHGHDYGDK